MFCTVRKLSHTVFSLTRDFGGMCFHFHMHLTGIKLQTIPNSQESEEIPEEDLLIRIILFKPLSQSVLLYVAIISLN